VEGLEQRNYVTTERDVGDARRLNVALTPAGEAYAWAVVEVINALNGALTERVDREALAGARKALLAVLSGEGGVRE
jgi:DNA-binding MarR family transcriptional regulator